VGATHRVRVTHEGDRLVLAGLGAPSAPDAAAVQGGGPLRTAGASPLAELRTVSVRYGDRVVLNGCSLAVRPSALTVVTGRSGSGKSTLLRILTGLDLPDAGEVVLAGQPLAGLGRDRLADARRAGVAVVEGDGALEESLDVRANLDLARSARGLASDPDADAALVERLGLAPLDRRPVGLLSGGERQRAGVARALAVGWRLVVLDEPTAHVDEAHAERLASALLAAVAAGTAVVCATHDPVLIRCADEVVDLARPLG
jgi:ABC-type lipoprotein export system ATPase subunit